MTSSSGASAADTSDAPAAATPCFLFYKNICLDDPHADAGASASAGVD